MEYERDCLNIIELSSQQYVISACLTVNCKNMILYDTQKLVEIVLYILHKTAGLDYYHIFKILYFAEMKHLAKWGTRMVSDDFCALKYGPVPTRLYNAVKELGYPRMGLAKELDNAVMFAGDDAPNVLLARRLYNGDFLSMSEIEALDSSIAENANLTFATLKSKSHDAAYDEADRRVNGTNIISPISMARVMRANDAMIDYIREQIEIDKALQE